jgi:phosphohistidine phosphatase
MVIRNIIFLRHAKSNLAFDYEDKDRVLTSRGIEDSKIIGKHLSNLNLQLDYVICSTAKRTVQTSEIIFESLKSEPELYLTDDLYQASFKGIINIIKKTPENYKNIMIVGHNPGMQNITTYLTCPSNKKPYLKLIQSYPTGAIAIINFDISNWTKLEYQIGNLMEFTTPKMI